MLKFLNALGVSLFLSGCVTSGHSTPAQLAEYKKSIPVCYEKTECQKMWSAARRWILNNSGYKLQHITSDYMETYNPRNGDTDIAFRASLEPSGDGYRIVGEAWCGNMFGCVPVQHEAMINFNQYVSDSIYR